MSKPEITAAMLEAINERFDGKRELGKVEYSQVGDGAPTIISKGITEFSGNGEMTAETISGIGSITKQFTAATLIKLWDEELSKSKKSGVAPENFPEGIDTPISNFMPRLREKFPQCDEFFGRIEADESYEKITLRDLLNHTHGLGGRDNGKAVELVRRDDNPIELADIINVTQKTDHDKHGQHSYSNFGFDFAAMIVEAVAEKSFDEVVREKVLQPNGLTSTHPQSDHLALYDDPTNKLTRGYILDDERFGGSGAELNFNVKSNTRAAGGFKSTVGDLAKFAHAYMGAEMFENEEVRTVVRDCDRGAAMSAGSSNKYHLAMSVKPNGTLSHAGADCDFYADLCFNPKTGEVKTWLSVVEDLSLRVCEKIFAATNPQDVKILEDFNTPLSEKLVAGGKPEIGSEEFNKIAVEVLGENPEAAAAMQRYSELRQEILKIPASELVEKREEIIARFVAPSLQISYEITPPEGQYETFKANLQTQAGGFERISYDDKRGVITLPYADRDVFNLKMKMESGDFRRHPKDYESSFCKRFEGGVEKSFTEARAELNEWYQGFSASSTREESTKINSEELAKAAMAGSLVIAESHPDIEPKKKLIELLAVVDKSKTVLILENIASTTYNADLKTWLNDGNSESELPAELAMQIESAGGNYAGQARGSGFGEDYQNELRASPKEILRAAKRNGVEVRFIESDLTIPDEPNSRHAALVKNLQDLKTECPDKNFILLAGSAHEKGSVTFSNVLGATTCEIEGQEFQAQLNFNEGFELLKAGDSKAKGSLEKAEKMGFDVKSELAERREELGKLHECLGVAPKIIAERLMGDFCPTVEKANGDAAVAR